MSSTEFDAIRSRSNPIIPPRRADDINPRILLKLSTNHFLKTTLSPLRRRTLKANNEPPRISPHRLMAAGAIRINSFQDVKDHLSSSGFVFLKFMRATSRGMGFSPFHGLHSHTAPSSKIAKLKAMMATLVSGNSTLISSPSTKQINDIKVHR